MFSFTLPREFVDSYADQQVPWGYSIEGNNSLGEITFIRTYSRIKEDGTKERWHEVCERVINGMYSIQKDHVKTNKLPWNDRKAQASAQEAFDRMFNLKWTPPGRGLWMMGTPFVMDRKNSGALQNCAFWSSGDIHRNDPGAGFAWVMDALMLGVGVGFDTVGADKHIEIHAPDMTNPNYYTIPDTREGWAESVRLLLNSMLKPEQQYVAFDYTLVRPRGEPIKGFGGVASGPEPLIKLHEQLRTVIGDRTGEALDSRAIVDIVNLIGTCVVAGNVRRSATLALGSANDKDFINLKNADVFPDRNSFDAAAPGWAWMSNNSVVADDIDDFTDFTDLISDNGEPGFIWLRRSQRYGRLKDPRNDKDHRVRGYNPCAEQSLESYECCTLVEVHLNNHESYEDFQRSLKFAYLYGKTVTLLPTEWAQTNAVMQRNRRIGTSLTGIANFADQHGIPTLKDWMDDGYENVQYYDKLYSEWLGIRESVKTTTVKPSGTVSLLSGASPGVHWNPGGNYFMRTIRFADDDPMLAAFAEAGYRTEPAVQSANTTVVYFPVATEQRSEKDVTVFEKAHLATIAQRYWSDNSVSVTVSFDKRDESQHLNAIMHMFGAQLKTISFLPMGNEVYPQQPYTEISRDEYLDYASTLKVIDWSPIYENYKDAEGERYCSNDTCML